MTCTVYIIYSSSVDTYYVGQTADVQDRLFRHNNSGSKSTKKASDWKLVHQEEFNSRSAACTREADIKKKKSRRYIETLIDLAK